MIAPVTFSKLDDQLGVAFVAVFSFLMGLLLTPILALRHSSADGEEAQHNSEIDVDEALFGTFPSDRYKIIAQAERNIMNSDVGRLRRLINLEALLLRHHVERPVIAESFRVSVDTIRRDIQTLVSMGSDAEYTPKRGWRATQAVFATNLELEPKDDEVHVESSFLGSGEFGNAIGGDAKIIEEEEEGEGEE